MASEQSSQSHPPRAWPEAEEPPPTWAQDPLGTSSPRLPLPQDEPRVDGSWQTSPGTTSPGNGWQQAAAPQGGNDGWQQTPGPQGNGDGWQQASSGASAPGNGWQQAGAPQGGNPGRLPGGGDGWQQAAGSQGSGDGWQQAAAPQGGNDGWQQASGPQTDASWQTSPGNPSPGNGWQQASGPQGGNPSRLPGGSDGWQQASGPQGNGGWQQPAPGAPSPNDGRQQPSPGNGRQVSSLENVWLPATPAQGGNDARQQASGPQGGGQGRPQAPGSPPAEPWQTSAAPRENLGSWPPAQGAENGAWPPAPPVESTAWNAGPPASRDPLFSPPSWANPPAEAPASWANPPAEVPVAPFGGAPSGNGAPLGNGRSNGGTNGTNGGNGAGPAPRRSYGVPDNPAMWALAAATAAAASSAASDVPVFPPRGPDVPPGNNPHTQQTVQMQLPQAPPTQPGQPGQQGQPGHHLSRDPSDPNKPFVTAGQISGPKTPPPERQQELWNTVFGENYQAMDEEEDLEGQGRPVWVFALAGSVVLALILALLWAFIAGPLASTEEEPTTSTAKPAATGKSAAKPKPVGRLPRFPGEASPVAGTLTDQGAGITLAKLSTPWRQDQRPTVPTVFGFSTRQYLPAGPDSTGKTQFAQVMSGPLSPRLKSKYTSPENLAPVINAVASAGRKKFFPEDNTARKTAQQTLTVNGLPGQLAAYEITSGEAKTTMVVAAVNTGADLPAIVYMSVPDSKKELLPDINTVFKSIKASTS
ncbi:hypothetical protein SAMN05216276_1011106 [Streptosporangium subroseum]|uniref:Uncharacterized protein n=1 Tax=Streptosporangium subroseum TaxID=106412 RepID=A0A239FEB4_9ACTN|nr:hypothetical protein [Streptosporangium subroseum]SNS54858.1 hypothetical protein SAMN05216276_1011106 [Streptosporangium subroseum]